MMKIGMYIIILLLLGDIKRYKELAGCNKIQIWTSDGWQNFKKFIGHKTEKVFFEKEQNMELLM